jgi:predicted CXXCH cytochrome family protein
MVLLCGFALTEVMAAQNPPPPQLEVLGVHDLGAGNSPLRGQNANACLYCHAPHNALSTTPLWNQTLSTKPSILYPSATDSPGNATTVGPPSVLCLSCHDGTVAAGQTVAFGMLQMTGALTAKLGTDLSGSHPFSIQPQMKDAPSLVATLVGSHQTKEATVKLVNDNIECNTCHDVHNQFRDSLMPKFLVRANTSGKLCFACHDTGARTVNNRTNSLTAWPNSIHAISTATIAVKAGFGGYANVGQTACGNCHSSHNALGLGLLRKNPNWPPNTDETSQACLTCHDGSDTLTQPIMNVLADFNTPGQKAHPFADATNQHTVWEPIVLERNRHATCADCHAAHAAQPTLSFDSTGNLRPSQMGVAGVGADAIATNTAAYQYENCLRCHGKSAGKQSLAAYGYMPARALFTGDTLDVSLQLGFGALSAHPVMRGAVNLARPSVLRNMWDISFKVQTRPMSSRLLCTDCHNSDKNREFGGIGPNGVHGSKNDHILERQYVMSQVMPGALPGTTIANLQLNPVLDASVVSPYALCAKCHDLNYINSGASWPEHARHIQDGFSCSACHSSHGVPAGTTGVTGQGLVSFDMNVVRPKSAGQPVSYLGGSNCTLTCHNHPHGQ